MPSTSSPLPPPAIDEADEGDEGLSTSYQSTDTVRRHPEAGPSYGMQAPLIPRYLLPQRSSSQHLS